jgi:hypothetical protein
MDKVCIENNKKITIRMSQIKGITSGLAEVKTKKENKIWSIPDCTLLKH